MINKKAVLGILMAGTMLFAAVPVSVCAQENTQKKTETTEQADTADTTQTTDEAGASQTIGEFKYIHDPMENPKATQDIIVNHKAVYGYSPSPRSTRLKEFVNAIDWTDPTQVAEARAKRIEYHEQGDELYQMLEKMLGEGKSTEEIARALSKRRNELRLEAYKDDPEGLARVKRSNKETYGHEEGPTADELYAKYGSWEIVIEKALSSNPGMDACLGLYDDYYYTYQLEDEATADPDHLDPGDGTDTSKEAEEVEPGKTDTAKQDADKTDKADTAKQETAKTDKADTAKQETAKADKAQKYTVKAGDTLWKIAKHFYNDGSKWTVIQEANKDKISDTSKIKEGTVLVIPAQK